MNYGLSLYSAPAIEPVTVAEARRQCDIAQSYTAHDQQLSSLITAARYYVENYTNRSLITQTWDLTLDGIPFTSHAIKLPKNPIQSVTHVKYYDSSNVQQTWTSSNYIVSIDREPATIRLAYNCTWPQYLVRPDTLTIRFVAGYGATADLVPMPIKQAMLLLIAYWFEQRAPVNIGSITTQLDFTLSALLEQYRVGDEFTMYAEFAR